jgi:hypothetical protein
MGAPQPHCQTFDCDHDGWERGGINNGMRSKLITPIGLELHRDGGSPQIITDQREVVRQSCQTQQITMRNHIVVQISQNTKPGTTKFSNN